MGLFKPSQAPTGADASVFGRPPRPRRRRLLGIVRFAVAVLVFLGAGAAVLLTSAFSYYSSAIPDPLTLRRKDTAGVTVRVLARDGSVLAERGGGGPYVPIDLLPQHLIKAVLAIEDRRFFSHWGVDPVGL